MRTDTEVLMFMGQRQDVLGFHGDAFRAVQRPLSREAVMDAVRDLLPQAWEKAGQHDSHFAAGAIEKLKVWLYMMGEDGVLHFVDAPQNFRNMGCPVFFRVAEYFDLGLPEDGRLLNMAHGLPCRERCEDGCL